MPSCFNSALCCWSRMMASLRSIAVGLAGFGWERSRDDLVTLFAAGLLTLENAKPYNCSWSLSLMRQRTKSIA